MTSKFCNTLAFCQQRCILNLNCSILVPHFNPSTPPATTASINEIMQMEDPQSVSCLVYINMGNRPVVPVQLPYRVEPINKKEVAVNDDSGSLKLTLWDTKFLDVPSSGSYFVINAVVRYKPHNQHQNHYPDFRERSNINKSTYRFGFT